MLLRDGDLTLELEGVAWHIALRVPTFFYRMVHSTSRATMGGINLRHSDAPHVRLYAGHIGYHVCPEFRGRRYAARAVTLLLPQVRELGIDPLWITCDPDNLASRRTLEIAGCEFVEIVDTPTDSIHYRDGHPRKCRYRLMISR